MKRNINERDVVIYNLRKGGKTLQAIADMFGVTRERIRQICAKLEERELTKDLDKSRKQ